jgi:HTH-type transcriptional regulator, competence development regulator
LTENRAYLLKSVKGWHPMANECDIEQLVQIGSRIRHCRLARSLNLHELALLCGISAPALSLIENGKRDLRITSLIRIASALRTEVAELVKDRPTDAASGPIASGFGYDLGDYT